MFKDTTKFDKFRASLKTFYAVKNYNMPNTQNNICYDYHKKNVQYSNKKINCLTHLTCGL